MRTTDPVVPVSHICDLDLSQIFSVKCVVRDRRFLYLDWVVVLRRPRPALGHRAGALAGRVAHSKPSGPAASSIWDCMAAKVGEGAAVASIAPAHVAAFKPVAGAGESLELHA